MSCTTVSCVFCCKEKGFLADVQQFAGARQFLPCSFQQYESVGMKAITASTKAARHACFAAFKPSPPPRVAGGSHQLQAMLSIWDIVVLALQLTIFSSIFSVVLRVQVFAAYCRPQIWMRRLGALEGGWI